jgi:hypothetical protein
MYAQARMRVYAHVSIKQKETESQKKQETR